jgi:hypothetical protein
MNIDTGVGLAPILDMEFDCQMSGLQEAVRSTLETHFLPFLGVAVNSIHCFMHWQNISSTGYANLGMMLPHGIYKKG